MVETNCYYVGREGTHKGMCCLKSLLGQTEKCAYPNKEYCPTYLLQYQDVICRVGEELREKISSGIWGKENP